MSEAAFPLTPKLLAPASLVLIRGVPMECLLGDDDPCLTEIIPSFAPLWLALSDCNRSISSSFLAITSLRDANCKNNTSQCAFVNDIVISA